MLEVANAAAPDDPPWLKVLIEALQQNAVQGLEKLAKDLPDSSTEPATLYLMGTVLRRNGLLDSSITLLTNAQQRFPGDFWLNEALGTHLLIKATSPAGYFSALPFLVAAVALRPDSPVARTNLGNCLTLLRKLDAAIAEYRKALENWDSARTRVGLGVALDLKSDHDAAIAEFEKALQSEHRFPAEIHNNLANSLRKKGDVDRAIGECRKAIESSPEFARAWVNLALGLRQKGAYREALEAVRKGHEIGIQKPPWPYPTSQIIAEYEHLAKMDERLAAVLDGGKGPSEAEEYIHVAKFAMLEKQLYPTAARLFEQAFLKNAALADDLQRGNRYAAACAAAQAATGPSSGALDNAERVRWRNQALVWLKAELHALQELALNDQQQAPANGPKPAVVRQLITTRWLKDPELAGIREPEQLGNLPESERSTFAGLWEEARALLEKLPKPP